MARPKKVQENVQPAGDLSANDLLKAKLKAKFNLLKDEPLNFTDQEQLLNHVCTVLGMDRPKLDWILLDL